eukprot:4188980-Pyramimonas_sp.AAC.1
MAAAAHGAAFIMEHPDRPGPSHLPSCWSLPEVRHFTGLIGKAACSFVEFISIDQCEFNSRGQKPTCLLT